MICISIAEQTVEDCLKALKGVELAEIRMDRMKLSEDDVARIFAQPTKLIATCRPGMEDEKRKRLLEKAIESGAAYVDIEVESREDYKKSLSKKAKEKGCSVIISFHDYNRTPKKAELEHTVNWCLESGADLVKIACKVNSVQDSARLLGLLDSDKKMVVVGMGEKGRITRVVATLLGSPFTFASLAGAKETAEGQIEAEKLKKMMKALEND